MKGPISYITNKLGIDFVSDVVAEDNPKELQKLKRVTELGIAAFTIFAAGGAYGVFYSSPEVTTNSDNSWVKLGAEAIHVGFQIPQAFLFGVSAAAAVEVWNMRRQTIQKIEEID